jgi:hypothetical protein
MKRGKIDLFLVILLEECFFFVLYSGRMQDKCKTNLLQSANQSTNLPQEEAMRPKQESFYDI